MQARLPDINTAYIKYRNEVLGNLKSGNRTLCIGALYALNGLLPKEYRVVISDLEFNNLTRKRVVANCPNCKEEIDYKDVKIHKILLPFLERNLNGHTHDRIWICPKCKKENNLEKTEFVKESLKEPHFLKVVPKPPEQNDGLLDRTTFQNSFQNWAATLLVELEAQMATFRDDNWNKGEDYVFDMDGENGQALEELDASN